MNERKNPVDPSLDVPAEANTTKHANFLDNGEDRNTPSEEVKHRRERWEEGLKEGEEARTSGSYNQSAEGDTIARQSEHSTPEEDNEITGTP